MVVNKGSAGTEFGNEVPLGHHPEVSNGEPKTTVNKARLAKFAVAATVLLRDLLNGKTVPAEAQLPEGADVGDNEQVESEATELMARWMGHPGVLTALLKALREDDPNILIQLFRTRDAIREAVMASTQGAA